MKKIFLLFLLPYCLFSQEYTDSLFNDVWIHSGKTSAVIFWQINDISKEVRSYVEYGETIDYDYSTETKSESRRAQLHSIINLTPGQEYHFRMVIVNDKDEIIKSEDRTFTTNNYEEAVVISKNTDGSVIRLDQPNKTYILTEDIVADAIAIEIAAEGITLELDGHNIFYSQNSDEDYINGILITVPDAKIYNGGVIQGPVGGNYSYAVGARWRADGVEIAGLNINVNRPNAYPISLAGSAKNIIDIHHNYLYSTVKKIESRHYPGNDLIRVDAFEENAEVSIHHNILTEGCHCGISMRGPAKSLEINDNDIRHHQQFVNGYALYGSGMKGGKIHDNRISSIGRTIHLTAPDIEFYNNWASTKGHMTLDDMPQGSDLWYERRVELHGIKFEGENAKNIKVHDNYMEINQPQQDAYWDYVPATPLNLACYDPNAMNEIYNNKIIAHTTYKQTHHGGYGESGEWASAIYFVGMNYISDPEMFSAYIHHNEFISNDLFISGDIDATHIVRIEDNVFRLGSEPTDEHSIFRTIPQEMQDRVLNGNNIFIMDDTTSSVANQHFFSKSDAIKVIPNPASDYIEITLSESSELSDSFSIKLYNILGECVLRKETMVSSTGRRIVISELTNGIYTIIIHNNNKIISEKFLVIH
ncbi:MAG: T9SS type A sorting domain-containing protein [bacterium]